MKQKHETFRYVSEIVKHCRTKQKRTQKHANKSGQNFHKFTEKEQHQTHGTQDASEEKVYEWSLGGEATAKLYTLAVLTRQIFGF